MIKSNIFGKLAMVGGIAGVLFFSLSLISKDRVLTPTKQEVVEIKKSSLIPTANTSEQLAEHHGIERVIDTQLGVICYKMIQKGTLSCVPLRSVGAPPELLAPPPA